MKKIVMATAALALVFGLGSCKSKKSAYRKAYEEAKQREIATQEVSRPVVYEEPVATDVAPQATVSVRKERVSVLDGENGANLKRYSVVIGSFQNPTNARALREKMTQKGYSAVLAKNEMGMLRVIVSSFNTREEAAASRDAIKSRFAPEYKDAWILANE
ncbi:MAG: SPOR domain-containing protein [Porphyromonas sp.]|nr:SPOR domain-containing protein [Porphyromonas sp.]